MKTAIYIEDGVTQLVLTPQTEWEQSIISQCSTDMQSIDIIKGCFYEGRKSNCTYIKKSEYVDDESLIISMKINPL